MLRSIKSKSHVQGEGEGEEEEEELEEEVVFSVGESLRKIIIITKIKKSRVIVKE